jgi:hypothetical protein
MEAFNREEQGICSFWEPSDSIPISLDGGFSLVASDFSGLTHVWGIRS